MIVQVRDAEPQPRTESPVHGRITTAAFAAAFLAGLLGAVAGWLGIVVAVVIGLVCLVAWRPVLAVYLYLATLPFIAGIERGALIPLIRPNEGLLVLLIAGAMIGGYVRALRGVPLQLRLRPWDVPLAAFFLLATFWPISSMLLRGILPSAGDVSAVLPACKLAGLLLLVRITVRTPRHVLWCIRLIIGSAVGVAAIAVLQSLSVEPIPTLLLGSWYRALAGELHRGTTTLSNAIATGDYILIGLTLLVTAGVCGLMGWWARIAAGLVLVAGVLAVGQVSIWLAALLIGALIVRRLPSAKGSALRLAPILGIALLVGAPALFRRIGSFFGDGFPPQGWRVRWDNVAHHYLPELLENGQLLVGVSPNWVLVSPDTWREFVYLESGYLQFLWVGGVPLLLGFVVLSRAVLSFAGQLGKRSDGVGACASALVIVWWMVVFLLVFDAHLFMRGPGDLIFALLGVVASRAVEERNDDASG
ncbi:hypothetical protein [Mycobacterium sp.]|uniref:hypothetical protein n=1 Tax=Mycobacterium sp. TaxID=1785 RepID=UPI002DAD358A|nr:hypothetical protein [Mycobacterium sp.]